MFYILYTLLCYYAMIKIVNNSKKITQVREMQFILFFFSILRFSAIS